MAVVGWSIDWRENTDTHNQRNYGIWSCASITAFDIIIAVGRRFVAKRRSVRGKGRWARSPQITVCYTHCGFDVVAGRVDVGFKRTLERGVTERVAWAKPPFVAMPVYTWNLHAVPCIWLNIRILRSPLTSTISRAFCIYVRVGTHITYIHMVPIDMVVYSGVSYYAGKYGNTIDVTMCILLA